MRTRKRREAGQAVALLVLGFVGLVAFAALAIDGSRIYAELRHAQNAADNAALAAAWSKCLGRDFTSQGLMLARENGYDNDGVGDIVTVYHPPTVGAHSGNSNYLEVTIVSNFSAALMQFIRPGGLQVTVRAVAMCVEEVPDAHAALHTIGSVCNNSLRWAGSGNTVQGSLHSNNDIQVTGNNNLAVGNVNYVTTIDANPSKITIDPLTPDNPKRTRILPDPLGWDVEDYAPGGAKAAIAEAAGQYVYRDGDITINWLRSRGYYDNHTRIISDGLYYATGDVSINGNDVIGNAVTFVTEGDINFVGSGITLTYYMDDLLGFSALALDGNNACSTPVIKFATTNSNFTGIFYAPYGSVDVGGNGDNLLGGVVAESVSFTGNGLTLINIHPFITADPGSIEITE
jgi:hypothetical protein